MLYKFEMLIMANLSTMIVLYGLIVMMHALHVNNVIKENVRAPINPILKQLFCPSNLINLIYV